MTRLDATKFKLAEAQFFYGKLSDLGRRVVLHEPAAFRFYLSAFLSAARSVTFVLQAEEKDRYDAWFPGWLADLPADRADLLVKFNTERVATVHQTGARVYQEARLVSGSEYLAAASLEGVDIEITGPPGVPLPPVHTMTWSFRFNGSEAEATSTAGEYLTLLHQLVADFEGHHAEPTAP